MLALEIRKNNFKTVLVTCGLSSSNSAQAIQWGALANHASNSFCLANKTLQGRDPELQNSSKWLLWMTSNRNILSSLGVGHVFLLEVAITFGSHHHVW